MACSPGTTRHLVAVAHEKRTACKGAEQKEQAMTTAKPRPSIVHGESHSYPVLPLRDIVVFPHMIVPLFVGREKSIRALALLRIGYPMRRLPDVPAAALA